MNIQSGTYAPPRFWWLKRMACTAAAYLLVLVAVRIWWGWEADRRFQATVEQRRAAGELVVLADFVRPPIANEDNAAYYLEQAAGAVKLPPGIRAISDIEMTGPAEAQKDLVLQLLELNREPLALIAAARGRPAADWNVRFTSPLVNVLLPQLQLTRNLARLEMIAAEARLEAGSDAGALEAIEDTRSIGATLTDQTLISHLVRIGIGGLVCNGLERMTPVLRIADGAADDSLASSAAARNQITVLIDELLDEATARRSLVNALYFERVFQTDTVAVAMAGGFNGPNPAVPGLDVSRLEVILLRPAWTLDSSAMFKGTSRLAEAAGMMNWPSAAARMPVHAHAERNVITWPPVAPAPVGPLSFMDALVHLFSSILWTPLERGMILSFRDLALRRMSATALAMRLYERDHGRRPDRLDDLVPDYLPAVPRDPFAADNRPLGYAPNASPPVLYSMNEDGVDDHGCFELTQAGYVDAHAADMVYFLNGDRPRGKIGAPASQPVATRPVATQNTLAEQPTTTHAAPDEPERARVPTNGDTLE